MGLGAELRVTKVSRSGIQSTKIDVMVNDKVDEPAAAMDDEQEETHGHGHHHAITTTNMNMTMTKSTMIITAMTTNTSTGAVARDSHPAHGRGSVPAGP